MKKKGIDISRRRFIGATATAAAAITILPSNTIAGLGHTPPSDKLNIAGIGVGGVGLTNLRHMESENIVALCDVDWDYASPAFKKFPNASKYMDFRNMLEKEKSIDAVVIATADHTHAIAALTAMRLSKHLYLQTPLTHSVYESRILTETARQFPIVTQMGNQGCSDEGIRLICEWIWSGVIGEVTEVHAWTDRPLWAQGMERPKGSKGIPRDLEWELFLGPAPFREYLPIYTPWKWRAWWDFGCGSLGDMGCAILDPAFKALKLQNPVAVEGSSTPLTIDSPPAAQKITWWFPARDNMPKVGMPEVKVYWYDGGLLPERPAELAPGISLGQDPNGGLIFIGTKGKIMCGAAGANPTLLPVEEMSHFTQPEKTLRRIPNALSGGHEKDWVRACKEAPDNRLLPVANFDYAGPMTEAILIGAMSVRLQSLKRRLLWDQSSMKFTNISETDRIKFSSKKEFSLIKGHPNYDTQFRDLKATTTIDEWIKPTYRNGWEQI